MWFAIPRRMSRLDSTPRRRLAALAALLLALATTAQFVALAIVAFPHATLALALVVLGVASASYGVVRRGAFTSSG